MNKLTAWLNQPKSSVGLGIFRVLFGVILLWDVLRIFRIGLLDSFYPRGIIFNYEFLEMPLVEAKTLEFIFVLLIIALICVILGVFYRIAMSLFFLGFTYFFLLDQTFYNNHLYMVCLLSFLMIFIPADASFGLAKKKRRSEVPNWTYRILQFQIAVVFFFGAVSKMNPYWFEFHPVKELLEIRAQASGNEWLNSTFFYYFICWGGFLFDLLVGVLLWVRKTRILGMIGAVFFSLSNAYLFNDIYIFPFLLIASLFLFADQVKLKARVQKWGLAKGKVEERELKKVGAIGVVGLLVFVIIQLALPVRHYFKPGYTDWTGEGQRFAWRMKIQYRDIQEHDFRLLDVDNKVIHEIELEKYLYPDEITEMCHSPQMVMQFVDYLEEEIAPKARIKNYWVLSNIKIGFNGEEPIYMFDPNLDLAAARKENPNAAAWINPLEADQTPKDSTLIRTLQ